MNSLNGPKMCKVTFSKYAIYPPLCLQYHMKTLLESHYFAQKTFQHFLMTLCVIKAKKTWEYHKEAKFWLILTHLHRAPCCVNSICEGLYYFKQV